MRKSILVSYIASYLLFCQCSISIAQTIDTVSASIIHKFLHYGDLVRFLEQENSYTIYQGVYQGQWSDGDPLIFSVQGNSYRNNKYYIDGMRVDDRFNTGSTLYRPNLETNNLLINYKNSRLYFEHDSSASDYIQVSGNVGGLSNVSSSSAHIVHWFHGTGLEGAYDKDLINKRQHTRGAGKVEAEFSILLSDLQRLRQHIYATYGQRMVPNINHTGLVRELPLYKADYFTVQMDGELPCRQNVFNRLGYLFHFGTNNSYGSAHYMNRNEISDVSTLSASLYGKRSGLIVGLTYALNKQKHKQLDFERNIVDQDGESLYPWSPDASSHEYSLYVNYERSLSASLLFYAECYNSLFSNVADKKHWSGIVYEQHPESDVRNILYTIDWQSRSFFAGLLENRLGVDWYHELCNWCNVKSSLDITLDGFLLKNKSHIMPHWQSSVSVNVHPSSWFSAAINVGYERIPYTMEHLRYMSNDFLNGKAYFGDSHVLAYTTGGAYHKLENKDLAQPSLFSLNIPFTFSYQRHEFMNYLVLKKYIHPWMTSFSGNISDNGRFEDGVFYQNPGECFYNIGYQPHDLMGRLPFFICHIGRYSYKGERLLLSVSWQSMMGAGPSALGVGPAANDIGVLDESTANPNTHIVTENRNGKYPGVGRVDQDKAYVARLSVGYNVCDWFSFNYMFKWTDGQPFSPIHISTSEVETSSGTFQQQAFLPTRSRGINPTDGDFGCRKSAIFNFDISAHFYWKWGAHATRAGIYYYNSWDYGNVLTEYMVPQGLNECNMGDRGPNMTLTVPGGLICSLRIDL
ncbi:MAG: hypothetical protein MJZ18_04130 [Bacteroidales bacterium]|nr:hypothetical protein [Bacteroidales bacterium]